MSTAVLLLCGAFSGLVFGVSGRHEPPAPGTQKWTWTVPHSSAPPNLVSDAVVSGDTVLVGSEDGNLYAVHANNGTTKWAFRTTWDIPYSPAISPDMKTVFVTSGDHALYAVDADRGTGYVMAGRELHGLTGSPVVSADGSTLFVCGLTFGVRVPHLYALNVNASVQPSVKWAFATNGVCAGTSHPVLSVDGAVLYVVTATAHVYAINTHDGTKKWEFATDSGKEVVSSPAVTPDGETLFFASWDNHLYALNAQNGKKKWAFNIQGPNYGSGPAVTSDGTTVFVGSCRQYPGGQWDKDANIYAVHAGNGTQKWIFKVGADVQSGPKVSLDGETIYIGANNRLVYALHAQTGAKKWAFKADGSVKASPAESADGAAIFVGSASSGTLYAINAQLAPATMNVDASSHAHDETVVV